VTLVVHELVVINSDSNMHDDQIKFGNSSVTEKTSEDSGKKRLISLVYCTN